MFNNQFVKSKLFLSLFSIIFFFILFFILKNEWSLWDGVVVEYAILDNNLGELKKLFLNASLILHYYLIKFLNLISHVTNVEYVKVNDFVLILLFIFLFLNITLFLRQIYNIKNSDIIIFITILISFPTWSILLTNVVTFHLFCINLFFLGIILYSKRNILLELIGLLLLFLSFQLNSHYLLSIIVFGYFYVNNFFSFRKNEYLIKLIILTILSFIIFILQNEFFPKKLEYRTYNQFYNLLNLNDLKKIFKHSIYFSTYLFPLFVFLIGVLILNYNLIKRNIDKIKKIFLSNFFIYLVILLIFSTIPYILVGKHSSYFDNDWLHRQSLHLTIFISIMIYYIYINSINLFKKNLIINFILVIIIMMNFIVQFNASAIKINRQGFEQDLIVFLDKNTKLFEPGIINIYSHGIPNKTYFRNYESNMVFFRAFRETKWFVEISNFKYKTNKMYNNMEKSYMLKKRNIMNNFNKTSCVSFFELDVAGFKNQNILKNFILMINNIFLNKNKTKKIMLIKKNIECK